MDFLKRVDISKEDLLAISLIINYFLSRFIYLGKIC